MYRSAADTYASVAQVFGLADTKPVLFKVDKLWLEIPIKKEIARLYHLYENGDIALADGSVIEMSCTSSAGKLPRIGCRITKTSPSQRM